MRTKLAATVLALIVGAPLVASARVPKDMREELQGYVDKHKDAKDVHAQQAAMLTLGRIDTREANEALETAKEDEQRRVRYGAGMGLWLAGDRRADDFLAEQLRDDGALYVTLTDVITVLPDDKEKDLLAKTLEGADAKTRRTIYRYAAAQHGELFEVVANDAKSKDEATRKAAVEALRAAPRSEAVAAGEAMLDSRTEAVRAAGVDLLAALGQEPRLRNEAVAALKSGLDDRSDAVQLAAARALVELGEDAGAVRLAKTLSAEEVDALKKTTRFLLEHDAKVKAASVRPLIDKVDDDEAKSLLWQLAATGGDAKVIDELEKMYRSTHYDQRLIAVQALGRTGKPEIADRIAKSLFEGNPTMRLYTAQALARLRSERALPALERALQRERDKQVKLAVIDALANIDSDQSAKLLSFQTTDRDPEIKRKVVAALRKLGNKQASNSLKILLQDRDLDVQWLAFLTALEIAPELATKRVSAALRNPPPTYLSDLEDLQTRVSPETLQGLYRTLMTHSNAQTRLMAVDSAQRIGEPMLPLLRELAADASTPDDVQRTILLALSERKAKADKPLFERLARSAKAEPVRRLAAWTLTEYATDDLEATFRGLLGHDDQAVQAIAAYGLATLKD